ncbi:hypothetical protein MAIT1_04818 [Magnetofaba australis IT-1]|uniref:Uncharacterized protein n=1 Tax=Magnetofaba australis IT-1 TaxID=1434232 RepID=A0A1Y2KAN1_9PROT|nr:hypothetical protein MAIT1_04818 [Magnetofaba australis IT-1]
MIMSLIVDEDDLFMSHRLLMEKKLHRHLHTGIQANSGNVPAVHKQCSLCLSIKIGSKWVPPEIALEKKLLSELISGENLSVYYGVCDSCNHNFRKKCKPISIDPVTGSPVE